MTEDLIEKIKYICKEDGEKFSKGNHLVIGYFKFKYFHHEGNKNKRVKVIEGQEKVFDYIYFREFKIFKWSVKNNWEKVVEEKYSQLKRKF